MSIFDRLSKKVFSAERELSAKKKQLQEQLHQQAGQPEIKGAPAPLTLLERRLQSLIERSTPEEDSEQPYPTDGSVELFLSRDLMTAYVCIFPPLFGGDPIVLEDVQAALYQAHIVFGVIEAPLRQVLAAGNEQVRILPIAHGSTSIDGKDGTMEELFLRQELPPMELAPNSSLEFTDQPLMQPIQKGESICRAKAPTPAQPGHNVLGQELPVNPVTTPPLVGGAHTRVVDGQLIADTDGLVFWDEDCWAVKPWRVLQKDLNFPDVHLKFQGDLYLRGNVGGGATLETDGNLVIDGEIFDATVTAGQNLLVHKGIHGGNSTVIRVGGQLQCPVIEQVPFLEVKGNLFANEVLQSTVISDQDVFVLGGKGLLSGGSVTAKNQIHAKQVGEDTTQTSVAVSVHGDLFSAVSNLKDELEQLATTQERLRKKIMTMRGASSVLSQERRQELEQMQELRKRMDLQEKDLKQQLKNARQTLATSLSGKIVCQTLRTPVTVQIGNYQETFRTPTTGCNIHVYLGAIVTR